MWCGAEAAMDAWLAREDVMRALHVAQSPTTAHRAAFKYVIEELDLRSSYRALAARKGVKLLIFNGIADANVPFNGQTDYWAREESILEDWEPWYATEGTRTLRRQGEPAAGHVRTYRTSEEGAHFRFVTVNGAGHEVPWTHEV